MCGRSVLVFRNGRGRRGAQVWGIFQGRMQANLQGPKALLRQVKRLISLIISE